MDHRRVNKLCLLASNIAFITACNDFNFDSGTEQSERSGIDKFPKIGDKKLNQDEQKELNIYVAPFGEDVIKNTLKNKKYGDVFDNEGRLQDKFIQELRNKTLEKFKEKFSGIYIDQNPINITAILDDPERFNKIIELLKYCINNDFIHEADDIISYVASGERDEVYKNSNPKLTECNNILRFIKILNNEKRSNKIPPSDLWWIKSNKDFLIKSDLTKDYKEHIEEITNNGELVSLKAKEYFEFIFKKQRINDVRCCIYYGSKENISAIIDGNKVTIAYEDDYSYQEEHIIDLVKSSFKVYEVAEILSKCYNLIFQQGEQLKNGLIKIFGDIHKSVELNDLFDENGDLKKELKKELGNLIENPQSDRALFRDINKEIEYFDNAIVEIQKMFDNNKSGIFNKIKEVENNISFLSDKHINNIFLLKFFELLYQSQSSKKICKSDLEWLKNNKNRLMDAPNLDPKYKQILEKILSVTDCGDNKIYNELIGKFDTRKKTFNNDKEWINFLIKKNTISRIIGDIQDKVIDVENIENNKITINEIRVDEERRYTIDLSEVSSYNIVQALEHYCGCQQIYKYFREKGYLEYGFDIDNGFFDKNGNIEPDIKEDLSKIIKKPIDRNVFAFENVDKESEYLKNVVDLIKRLFNCGEYDKIKKIINKTEKNISFLSNEHIDSLYIFNFFKILCRSTYEISEDDSKWIKDNEKKLINAGLTKEEIQQKLKNTKNKTSDDSYDLDVSILDNVIDLEKEDDYKKIFNISGYDDVQIIFKGKKLKFRKDGLFPFLILRCGALSDTDKIQVKYFVECYKNNGNFVKYLHRFNTLTGLENTVEENIKLTKYECNHEQNMVFLYKIKGYITKVLFSESVSDISFKNVVSKQEFIENKEFITTLENKIKEEFKKTPNSEELEKLSTFIEKSILDVLKKEEDFFSTRISMDNEFVVWLTCRLLEAICKKEEKTFDQFLKEKTTFFDKDNYKDEFANEPNKKNILLFSIAKRLYEERENDPKYQEEADSLIKYLIKNATKEMLLETDINGFNVLHIAVIKKEKEYERLILERAEELQCKGDIMKATTNNTYKHYMKRGYLEGINMLANLNLKVHRGLYEPEEYVRLSKILLNRNNESLVCGKNFEALKTISDDTREFVLYNFYPVAFACERKNTILRRDI